MWKEVLDDVIRKTLSGFEERLAAFGPNLLAMIVILAAGLVAASLVRLGLKLLLPRVRFDRFAERIGLGAVLAKGGIGSAPSSVVATVLAWAVLAIFVLLAIGALNLQIAMDLVSRAFSYLPQLLIAAVNAGLPSARFLAGAVHTAVLVLFVAMALEHLGVGRQIILASFTILFGGVVLALALAFGLAGRDMAREFLERVSRRPSEPPRDELHHL
jgi:Conserved TM helix